MVARHSSRDAGVMLSRNVRARVRGVVDGVRVALRGRMKAHTALVLGMLVLPGTIASVGCGGRACCAAACVSSTTVNLTDSGGSPVSAFTGTVDLLNGTVLTIDCPNGGEVECDADGFKLLWEAIPEMDLQVTDTNSGETFSGTVQSQMSTSEICCTTCDVADAAVGLQ